MKKTHKRIGVVAEDRTDCDTIKVLLRRLLQAAGKAEHWICTDTRSGNGCGDIKKKGRAWMEDLTGKGCQQIVLLHDLDRDPATGQLNDQVVLRRRLEQIAVPRDAERCIVIAIEELEAWFWADEQLIQRVGHGTGRAHRAPESLPRPKEKLIELSRGPNKKKPSYAVDRNSELAQDLDLTRCAERCSAFRALRDWVWQLDG